jgi:DNA primase (bacterial type)
MGSTLLVNSTAQHNDSEVLLMRFKHSKTAMHSELKQAQVELSVAQRLGDTWRVQYYEWYVNTLLEAIGHLPDPGSTRTYSSNNERLPGYKLSAQAVKTSVNLIEYIGRYIQLKQVSPGKYAGLCCFHDERVPSLFVYEARQDWYCYGCLCGGDILSFVELYNQVSFYEALKLLSEVV